MGYPDPGKPNPPLYAALADAINDKGILLVAKGNVEEALPYYEKSENYLRRVFLKDIPNWLLS